MNSTLRALLRSELAELSSYVPDAASYAVRLDANEAPPLLSESALARLSELASSTAWQRYPDARAVALREAVASRLSIAVDEVLVGAGSDEIINLLLTALGNPRPGDSAATILTTTPTFVMYRLSARVRGQRVVEVPLDDTWDLSLAGMLRAIDMCRPNLVFIAAPNNPTGTLPSVERVEAVIDAAPDSVIVLDEAYVDYASRDLLALRRHENVVVLRTLSKVGFAALRVGFLIGRPSLVSEVDKVRSPYNVPAVSQRLGRAVLEELWPDVRVLIDQVVSERQRVTLGLQALPGLSVAESHGNFLWVRTERLAGEVFEGLRSRGVLVRSFHGRGGRLAHQLRITVGTAQENDALLTALGEVLTS